MPPSSNLRPLRVRRGSGEFKHSDGRSTGPLGLLVRYPDVCWVVEPQSDESTTLPQSPVGPGMSECVLSGWEEIQLFPGDYDSL